MIFVDIHQGVPCQNSGRWAVGQALSDTEPSQQGLVLATSNWGGKSVDVVLALVRDPLAAHLLDSRDLDVRPAFNSAFEFLHGDIQPMPGESGKLRRSVKVARRLGQK